MLDINQELEAIGLGNILLFFSSGYPVSGSLSRSGLAAATGASTPLSKLTTLIIILICLSFLTSAFYYIPSAGLAAVIFTAVYNLLHVNDFMDAFYSNKGDFAVMMVTFFVTLLMSCDIGLAAGIGFSILMMLVNLAFNEITGPIVEDYTVNGVPDKRFKLVKLNGDLTFVTVPRINDLLSGMTKLILNAPDAKNVAEYRFWFITSTLDAMLKPKPELEVLQLPKLIILDFSKCRFVDSTGMQGFKEVSE